MKKALKWIGIIILVVVAGILLFAWMKNETRPVGTPSAEADALAQKMMVAVDKVGWDTTAIVQWTFPGGHDFLWDKYRNFVQVKWGEGEKVLLNTKSVTGKAYKNGTEITGEEASKMIQTAWGFFCNDSFWLNAPVKAFDEGTERSIVKIADGRTGLMVNYTSGGVTPGDAYVWILDADGTPTSCKMWVSNIPLGGTEWSWEKWETLPTGAKIAGYHKGLLEIPITNIKGAKDAVSFGLNDSPFAAIEN